MATRLPDPTAINTPSVRPAPLQGSFTRAAGVAERAASEFQSNLATLAARESNQLDDLQKENALNELRSRELELASGDDGFSKYRGTDAIQRNIVDDYTSRHAAAVSEIASTLKNPKQQAAFRTAAAGSAVSFKSALYRHVAAAADQVDGQVLNGTVAVEGAAAAHNWNNPQALNDSRARLEHTVDLYAERRSLPPEEASRMRLAALAPLHAGVATQAVAAGQLDYAERYLKENKDEMNVSDLLRLSGAISKQRGVAIGTSAAEQVIREVQQTTEPNDFARLRNSLRTVESGNRDFAPDGSPVTSPTGAKYAGQVLPSTAKDPGFGITPARDDSPEEYNRVSDEYLAAMLQRYDGDVGKALAAYNVGAGAVDKAIKIADVSQKKDLKPRRALTDLTDPNATIRSADIERAAGPGAPTDWFTVLTDPSGPGVSGILSVDQAKQVAAYVPKVLKHYSAGGGVAPRPTIVDVRRRVADQLQGQPQDVIDTAQARAERDYNDLTAAQQQREDAAFQQLIPLVDSGEVRTVDDIPPALASAMGQKRATAQKYITAARKAEDEALTWSPVATDFYYALRADTARLKQASTAQILDLAPEIGMTRTKALIDKKNEIAGDVDAEQGAQFDSDQFSEVAGQFGFKSETPDQRRALIPIRDRAEEALIGAQADAGKKLTRAEKRDVLNRMFVKLRTTETYRPWYSYLPFTDPSSRTRAVERRGYELRSPEQIAVPPEVRAQIVAAAKSAGIELTEAEIREEYTYQQVQRSLP